VSNSASSSLLAAINKISAGSTIKSTLEKEGVDTDHIVMLPIIDKAGFKAQTAQYLAVNNECHELVVAMADMSIFTAPPKPSALRLTQDAAHKWTVVDGNWPPQRVVEMVLSCKKAKANVAFEPVSVAKSARLFTRINKSDANKTLKVFPLNAVDLSTPNQHELTAMHQAARTNEFFESPEWWKVVDALGIPSTGGRDRFVSITNAKLTDSGIPVQAVQLLPFIPTIITKLGAEGVLLTELLKPNDSRLTDPDHAHYIVSRCSNGDAEIGGIYMRLFPAVEKVGNVVSVNGAGDTFLGVLVSGLARGLEIDEILINIAQRAAVMTLRSHEAVSPEVKILAADLDGLALLKA